MIAHGTQARRLAIGLAMLAGFVDALGFMSLGGVFVSFMSGNSTRFAVGIVDGTALAGALVPIGIIALFVLGVMSGRAIRHVAPGRPASSVLAFMTALLMTAGVFERFHRAGPAVALMATSMGAANNVFFRGGEVSIGVTYMTGTLVKFAQRLAGRLLGERDHDWLPYLLLWFGLVAGAIAGALGYASFGLDALWAGALLSLALTFLAFRLDEDTA